MEALSSNVLPWIIREETYKKILFFQYFLHFKYEVIAITFHMPSVEDILIFDKKECEISLLIMVNI